MPFTDTSSLTHIATIGAVCLALTAVIGRCLLDFWRISGCCCFQKEVNYSTREDGYSKINGSESVLV